MKTLTLLLSALIFFASCSSTTRITSNPSGARVYMNGESVGSTPYVYSDTKIVGTTTALRLELDGYEPFSTTLVRDEEVNGCALVSGIFFLVPLLWCMEYKPMHNYDLLPASASKHTTPKTSTTTSDKSKSERLRELKALLDDGIINQAEFEREKQKILDEDEE